MSHVKVTFNNEEPVVVAAVPSPAAPGSYIDYTRTIANAHKARDLRDPEAREEDGEDFRVTVEVYVPDDEDTPASGSEENVGAQFGNAPAVQGGVEQDDE